MANLVELCACRFNQEVIKAKASHAYNGLFLMMTNCEDATYEETYEDIIWT